MVEQPEQHSNSAALSPRNTPCRLAWYAAAAILIGYLIAIALASPLSFQDMPNHLARAVVMADLIFHHGAQFGGVFQYRFMAVPYILGDLILTSAVALLGPDRGSALWSCLVFLSWPLALLVYLRVARVPADVQLLTLLLATYMATDWFFAKGFFEFRLGLALTVLTLAVAELLRRRWSLGWYGLYALGVAAGYLAHLSTLVFVAAAVPVVGALRLWGRATSVRCELSLLVPIAALLAWNFGVVAGRGHAGNLPIAVYNWGTVHQKLFGLWAEIFMFSGRVDYFLLLLFLACIFAFLRGRTVRRALATPPVLEMLALALTFGGIYLVLPWDYDNASYVDLRATPLALLFVLFACFRLPARRSAERRHAGTAALVIAVLLAVTNLGYIARYFAKSGAWAAGYLAIVADVPRGAWVLPITTLKLTEPYRHAGTAVVFDARGLVPSLFSANWGDPVKYFRYLRTPYVPNQRWYVQHQSEVDWHQVSCSYRYLLLTQPFDPHRLGVATRPVAENSSAALLEVDPRACAAGRRRAT